MQLRCSQGRGSVRDRGQEVPRQHARVRGPGVVAVRGHSPAEVGPRQHPAQAVRPRQYLRHGPREPLPGWELGDHAVGDLGASDVGRDVFPGDNCVLWSQQNNFR